GPDLTAPRGSCPPSPAARARRSRWARAARSRIAARTASRNAWPGLRRCAGWRPASCAAGGPKTCTARCAPSPWRPGRLADAVLEADHLRKVFRVRGQAGGEGEIVAVDDLSFTLGEGESLAIVGESGSGKTTLARMLIGLERPTSGR